MDFVPHVGTGTSGIRLMSARIGGIILLLEHDEADVFFFRRALSSLNYGGTVRVVQSVGEARDYLQGHGKFADRDYFPMPDLIVSDLKVPGRTGMEFLEWVQGEASLRHIPFVMYSGAATSEEGVVAIALGARAFVRKELDFGDTIQAVREVLKHLSPETNVKRTSTP